MLIVTSIQLALMLLTLAVSVLALSWARAASRGAKLAGAFHQAGPDTGNVAAMPSPAPSEPAPTGASEPASPASPRAPLPAVSNEAELESLPASASARAPEPLPPSPRVVVSTREQAAQQGLANISDDPTLPSEGVRHEAIDAAIRKGTLLSGADVALMEDRDSDPTRIYAAPTRAMQPSRRDSDASATLVFARGPVETEPSLRDSDANATHVYARTHDAADAQGPGVSITRLPYRAQPPPALR
jgi:hypothetical protein